MPDFKLLDLGGHGPFVHLAPANGFPPATYRQLARDLAQGYHVVSLLPRPFWPGSRPESAPDWHPLAGDLIRGLDELGLSGIVGLGHSIGGVLTLWAAIERPDLFRAVILVDPVIFAPGMPATPLPQPAGLLQTLPGQAAL
jgi:pimeloyl-ACP methyl ester carboxylesterase